MSVAAAPIRRKGASFKPLSRLKGVAILVAVVYLPLCGYVMAGDALGSLLGDALKP